MSGKKFSIGQLAKWRRTQYQSIPQPMDGYMPFPVDWDEFNKLFFSKRNVIVEYPSQSSYAALLMMGFYTALKVAKYNTYVGMCNYGAKNGFPYVMEFARRLTNKDVSDNVLFEYGTTPFSNYRNRVLECDEWIMNADWSTTQPINLFPPKDLPCDGSEILKKIHETKGFAELDVNEELWTANRTLMGWEDKERKRLNRRFVIMWDDRGKEPLAEVMAKYPDQFLVIPYSPEKRMVDEWFARNDTMVDPGFDIKLMDGSIDARKVLLYAATNHLYDFRKFAKTLPEAVEPYISKQELKELL